MQKSIFDYKKIHMVGVKGTGMAALACVLSKNGYKVSGSDVSESFITTDETLAGCGIIARNFSKDNIHDVDAIVKSNAYSESNEEIKEVGILGMPIFSYAEVVAEFFNTHYGIAVAGSHGKTTTTAMLAHILKYAHKNITAIIGSRVGNWGSGAMVGNLDKKDALFVLEADEYKEAFLHYHPQCAIITNIDYDHPDYFSNREAYAEVFERFVCTLPQDGFLVYNADDKIVSCIAKKALCKTVAVHVHTAPYINLKLIGAHNHANAALALKLAFVLGVDRKTATNALMEFKGVARRLQYVGTQNTALVFDDFAHHPTEIKATLSAIRSAYADKKIIVIFQPHTYSRTIAFFDDFCTSFSDADMVIISDVDASARESGNRDDTIVSRMVHGMQKNGISVMYLEKNSIASYLKPYFTQNTFIITMGAGNIWKIGRNLLNI